MALTRSLTSATAGAPGASVSEKARPARRGTPSVRRKSGVTYRMMATLEPSPGLRRPSTAIGPAPMRVVYGMNEVKPADTTPGRPRIRSSSSRRNASSRCGVGYSAAVNATLAVSTWSTRNPGSTACRLRMVRIISPVENSTTTASATSVATRAACARRRAVAPVVVRAFRGARRSIRSACRKGTRPNTSPVTSTATKATASSRRSSVGATAPRRDSGTNVSRTPNVCVASKSPTTAPPADSNTPSTSSWRSSCFLLPPSAVRTANSRSRSAPRATSKPATFALAITSTRAAAASRSRNDVRALRTRSC
jgi:hypothetical protein